MKTVEILCGCGCGNPLPPRTKSTRPDARFIAGHFGKLQSAKLSEMLESELKKVPKGTCVCGCGGQLPSKTPYKTKHPNFLPRHFFRWVSAQMNIVPKPEDIPSGICECGCGGKTKIATVNVYSERIYKGYPHRYIKNHNHPTKGRFREQHPNWKGGKSYSDEGYVLILRPADFQTKTNRRYVLEHRYVMEKMLGRPLKPYEQIHHINGVKDDNRPENLELWVRSQPDGLRAKDFHCAGCRCFDHNTKD